MCSIYKEKLTVYKTERGEKEKKTYQLEKRERVEERVLHDCTTVLVLSSSAPTLTLYRRTREDQWSKKYCACS